MEKNIVIIGAGNMGRALGQVLEKQQHTIVHYWDTSPEKRAHDIPLQTLASEADIIFLCVNSWHVAEAVGILREYVSEKTLVCSLTKGIETTTKSWMPDFLSTVFPRECVALLSGPMLADEMYASLPTRAVLATYDASSGETLARLFDGTTLYIEQSFDPRSIAVASVLKNIYAMVLGMSSALEMGNNVNGVIVSLAIQEMNEIIQTQGGNPNAALGLAGLGDLVATGGSPSSRNRSFGEQLIKNQSCYIESEGSSSLPLLLEKLGTFERTPLLKSLSEIFINGNDPRTSLATYLATIRK